MSGQFDPMEGRMIRRAVLLLDALLAAFVMPPMVPRFVPAPIRKRAG